MSNDNSQDGQNKIGWDSDEANARQAGWNKFEDSEDPTLLVVAHEDRAVHFTGPNAWAEALAWEAQHDNENQQGSKAFATPVLKLPTRFVERPVNKVCSKCGSDNCGQEAAAKWDVLHQQWIVDTIYDKGEYCNVCDATNGEIEIQVVSVVDDYEQPFTIFVRQSDGRGTTHISVQRAHNQDLALLQAKEEASADWGGYPVDDITGIGIIAGDVDVIAWDDEAELSHAEPLVLPPGGE